MTGTAHEVRDVRPAPAGYRVRVLETRDGLTTARTVPVACFALVDSFAVDVPVATLERDVVVAYVDPEDGEVRPFHDLARPGRSAARVLTPGELDDAHDGLLAGQLEREAAARAHLTAVPTHRGDTSA